MKKILAIDDQEDNLTTIKAVIKSQMSDFKVLTALSGEEGIKIAQKEQPDTILLDIIMPAMDGFETCRLLKEDELTKHIPVVMITAIRTDARSRVKGLKIGADAFLSKPIDAVELMAQLNVMLRIKEAEDRLRKEKDTLEELVSIRSRDLQESEEKYRSIFEGAKDGIVYLDKNMDVLSVNLAFTEITDIPKEQVEGKSGFELVKKFLDIKQLPRVLGILGELVLSKSVLGYELYYENKLLELSSRKLENGKSVTIVRDITKRRQVEKDIRKLSTAVEQSPSVIVITNLDGIIEYANPKFSELTGYTNEEVIGENPKILKSGKQSEEVYKKMWKTISSGKEWRGEFHNKKKNGDFFWESVSISSIIDDQGKIINYLKVAEDITERKLAEEKLKETERRSHIWLENSPVCTKILDLDFNLQFMSAAGIMDLDIDDVSALYGKPYPFHFYPDSFKIPMIDNLKKAKKTGKIITQEASVVDTKGNELWYHSTIVPVYDVKAQLDYIMVVSMDITKRMQAELKLQIERDKLITIFESMEDGIYLVNMNHDIQYVNPSLIKDFGSYEGKKCYEYFHNLNEPCSICKNDEVFDGKTVHWEWTSPKNGKTYDLIDTPLINSDGSISKLEIFRDISERKLAEKELKESETRFKALHNASFGGIAIHDMGIIKDCNQGLSAISGYSVEELIGMNGLLLLTEDSREMVMNNIKTSYEKSYEAVGIKKNGEEYAVRLEARGIPYQGKQMRVVEFRDISEQKKAEKNLISALEKSKESDRLKSAFLANMSHEIRTPMNGIMGFANLLEEPNISSEEQNEYVKIINRSGTRMLSIINNLVDISKIEAGLMKVSLSKFNLTGQIEFLHSFFTPEAKSKGIKLAFKNSLPAKEVIIESDKEKVNAILTNLIKNAIKYTDAGSIEFGYQLITNASHKELEFCVRDTGIGIPADRQDAVFERFIQADIEDKQALEGAGLGLSIAKAYVEMLGGKIRMESIEGEGSSFYFTIPFIEDLKESNSQTDASEEISEVNQTKLKILIVEDDDTSWFYLKTIIKDICKEVLYAKNGLEAVELSQKEKDIDVILMDLKMPKMDGLEATKQIRKFNKEVIIIAQTAYALEGDRETAIEVGCDDYITKPIKKNELMSMLIGKS